MYCILRVVQLPQLTHSYACTLAYVIKAEYLGVSALNFNSNLKVFKKSTSIPFFGGILKEK